jgi:predicted dehydrogenase
MSIVPRRTFLAGSTAALASTLGDARPTQASVPRADRIRLAVMGVRGRGRNLAEGFASMKDAEVVFLCDVDQGVLAPVASTVAELQGRSPKLEADFRRVLDDPSIDALVIATPDHWHAPATVFACQAGKHVYVEKPASHTLWEGKQMVAAARKYDRVVQVGTQSRSATGYIDLIQALRNGRIGKVRVAKAWNSQKRPDLIPEPDTAPPRDVDYDLWIGPSPKCPFNPNRFHYAWHWLWDFGTGDMGNDGVHDIDIARWGLDVGLPISVCATAGRFANVNWETPDTVYATFQFPDTDALLIFEQRDWSPYVQEGFENGVAFYGSEGYILAGRAGWRLFEAKNKEVPIDVKPFSDEPHKRDFLDAIREGRRPNADILEGHHSAALVHLANITHRVGRSLKFDPIQEGVIDDDQAQAFTRRTYRAPFGVSENV